MPSYLTLPLPQIPLTQTAETAQNTSMGIPLPVIRLYAMISGNDP